MAIYHYSIQIIGRSQGRSAIAAAAYRSGERLTDEKTGEIKEYHRDVKPETMILAPEQAPEWVYDRQQLWNEVEKAEKRKDAQLCREINVALPRELTHDQQRELIKGYAEEQFINRGMIADISIHRDDSNNPHAHIMLTMREITQDGFGKKNREWNPEFAREKDREWNRDVNVGFVKSPEKCIDWRKAWADHANQALERAYQPDRISHLSHEARGLETLPQRHLGHQAHAMEERGIQTECGNHNRIVKQHNETVQELKGVVRDLQQYREDKAKREKEQEQWKHFTPQEKSIVKQAANLTKTFVNLPKIDERLQSIDAWEKKIVSSVKYLDWKEQTFKQAEQAFAQIDGHRSEIARHQEHIDNLNNWNPLKWSENKITKEKALQDIAYHEKQIKYQEQRLDYPKEKLGFSNREDFQEKFQAFRAERQQQLHSNDQQRKQITEQRNLLTQAKEAIKNTEIRRVASHYPNWQAAKYLTYEGAKAIQTLNDKVGKVAPIASIQKTYKEVSDNRDKLKNQIRAMDQNGSRLNGAKEWLEKYEKATSEIERLDSKINKAKRFFSDDKEKEYQEQINAQVKSKNIMTREFGVENREDFNRQSQLHQEQLTQKPVIEKEITKIEPAMNLLGNALKGIEQAVNRMQREQEREKIKQLQKTKVKNRSYDRSDELER